MRKYSAYKLKYKFDPFETRIKDAVMRKSIWWYIFVSFVLIFFLLLIAIPIRNAIIVKAEQIELTEPLVIAWFTVGLLMALSSTFYQDNNLDKNEYLKLCRHLGINVVKKSRTMIHGHIDNDLVKVVAYLEPYFLTYLFGPLFGYVPKHRIDSIFYPDYMNFTSQVNLFYPFSSSYKIDFELKIDLSAKPIIKTECPEINEVISNFVKELDYCHWKIIFNDQWLRLVIIGGAWQGELFARNIENGVNMFKELVAKMEGKYSMKDWKDYQVQWDKKTWEFALQGPR